MSPLRYVVSFGDTRLEVLEGLIHDVAPAPDYRVSSDRPKTPWTVETSKDSERLSDSPSLVSFVSLFLSSL